MITGDTTLIIQDKVITGETTLIIQDKVITGETTLIIQNKVITGETTLIIQDKVIIRESMVDCLRDQLIPPASLLETRRRAGGIRLATQTINHGLPFSPVNYLFKIYLFHTINSICFQMLCYSRWVRHVYFGINGPITAQLSNGPWQRSGITWSHLLLSFTFPYINLPITEGENSWDHIDYTEQGVNWLIIQAISDLEHTKTLCTGHNWHIIQMIQVINDTSYR